MNTKETSKETAQIAKQIIQPKISCFTMIHYKKGIYKQPQTNKVGEAWIVNAWFGLVKVTRQT
jgi:hypothetical protein